MIRQQEAFLKIAAIFVIVGALSVFAGILGFAWPTIQDIWSRSGVFGKVSIVGFLFMVVGTLIFVAVAPPINRPTVKPPQKWNELDD